MLIYYALIANFLMTVIQKTIKRKWAFPNLVIFCKIHLFNYIHLTRFLENPEKDWQKPNIYTGVSYNNFRRNDQEKNINRFTPKTERLTLEAVFLLL